MKNQKIQLCTFLVFATILFSSFDIKAQNWTQIGSEINGMGSNNWLSSIDLSADGTRLIIGENSYSSPGFSSNGRVQVFELVGGNWNLMGTELYGEASGNGFGISTRITPNGNTIVCGESRCDVGGNQAGQMRVFSWDGSSWQPKGNWIQGDTDAEFGTHVDISSDGNRIAIGAPYPSNTNSTPDIGKVQVYEWTGSSWIQLGSDIIGDNAGDLFGANLSMDMTGNVVAICGRSNNGGTGQVKVYEWNGISWIQRGGDFIGSTAGEYYGTAVALDADGSSVAIGAAYKSSNNGQVEVFDWNGSSWNLRGSSLVGVSSEWLGHSVDLTDDGNILAVGAPWSDNGGLDAGASRCFQWDGSSWNNVGNEIVGNAIHNYCGAFDISLSSAGEYMAVMAYGNDSGGNDAGQTRVFSTPYLSTSELTNNTEFFIYPNPSSDYISVSLNDQDGSYLLEITNIWGQKLVESELIGGSEKSVCISNFESGTYFILIYNQNGLINSSRFVKK